MSSKEVSGIPPEVARATTFLWVAFVTFTLEVAFDWTAGHNTPSSFEKQFAIAFFPLLAYGVIYTSKGINWIRYAWLSALAIVSVAMLIGWDRSKGLSITGNLDGACSLSLAYATFLMFTKPGSTWFLESKLRREGALRVYIHSVADELYIKSSGAVVPSVDEVRRKARVSKAVQAETSKTGRPSLARLNTYIEQALAAA